MSEKREAKCGVFRSVEEDQVPEESTVASGGTNQDLPDDPPDLEDTEQAPRKNRVLKEIGARHVAAERKVRVGD